MASALLERRVRFRGLPESCRPKIWQILPVGPTSYGDSPYQSFSTYAGNPYMIDLDTLVGEGLLNRDEIADRDWGSDPETVDYEKSTTRGSTCYTPPFPSSVR